MATKTTRSTFRGCQQVRGWRPPAGAQLSKQNVELPQAAGGGRGHVYHHAPTSTWYTVGGVAGQPGVYNVCTYVGGTCPCSQR